MFIHFLVYWSVRRLEFRVGFRFVIKCITPRPKNCIKNESQTASRIAYRLTSIFSLVDISEIFNKLKLSSCIEYII